ncbi:hypothetical protein TWF718_010006 [Orbilia javanica]|uniref:tyrosinase n=1 Tax=Orbilia javanica TaxID=47235 RepID=A0AAN8RFG6_9PEZI
MAPMPSLLQAVAIALSLNGVAYAFDTEADWAFAANNLVKKSIAVPTPTQTGQPKNCAAWVMVTAASSKNCDTVIDVSKESDLTEEKFLEFNPALNEDCTNLKQGTYVCVRTASAAAAAKTATATKKAETAEEDQEAEEEEEEDRHADNPDPPIKYTKKNPALSTTLEADEKDPFVVTGAGNTNTKPRFCAERRDLVKLQKELPDTFNLLVLALEKMMGTVNSPMSYYALSGIHGAPFVGWPDVKEKGQSTTLGYCSHNSVIFATWHRPYILAFEQTLYRHARAIVRRNFTATAARTKYVKALQHLRWPYWDWSDSTTQSSIPKALMDEMITVQYPNGKGGEVAKSIKNPFYSYTFKTGENDIFKKGKAFEYLGKTARRPESSGSNESMSDAADNAMRSGYETRRKQTYNALTSVISFNNFANALEKLHNDVHMAVGGMGVMGLISYAAFDPVFWLHHNNIDRMLAIWQAANPGKYLTADTASSSYMRRVTADDKDDLDTPLYPWKHPNGKVWTSNDVKDVTAIWDYGYGYPEVPCYFSGDSNSLDDHATQRINMAYSDTGTPRIRGRAAVATTTSPGENVTEWDINIIVDQAELPGTFSIYVFLGNPPADPNKWDMSTQKVSTMTLLGNPGSPKMSKLEGMTIPLSPLLAKKGVKGTEKDIQEYLAKHLVWTCLSLDEEGGTKPCDVKKMKSLKVAVTSKSVIMPTDMMAKPKVGKAKIQPAATKDKAKSGGASTLAELAHTKLKTGGEAHLRVGVLPDIQNTTVTGGKI